MASIRNNHRNGYRIKKKNQLEVTGSASAIEGYRILNMDRLMHYIDSLTKHSRYVMDLLH